jgi:hypothetical protein
MNVSRPFHSKVAQRLDCRGFSAAVSGDAGRARDIQKRG